MSKKLSLRFGGKSVAGIKPVNQDDGSWKISSDDGKKMKVKGLLRISDDFKDINVYYLSFPTRVK